jgi:hypothetical protein
LEKAYKEANKMNIVIEGFLNISRLESGKIPNRQATVGYGNVGERSGGRINRYSKIF